MSITTDVVSSNLDQGEVYVHYVIKFVSATSVVFSGTPVSSFNKTDRHDVAEILLKVALNTISQTKPTSYVVTICCVQLSQVRGDYLFC
jgi:hypothetical protein